MASLARSRGIAYPGPACPHCQNPLDLASLRSGSQSCARCQRPFEAVRFDPPAREARAASIAEAGPAGGAACAQHRGNVAVANCGRCGVFLCSVCRIDSDGLVLCPGCFDRLSAEGALPSATVSYRDYGRMAGSLAVLSVVLAFTGVVSGPAAVYYGIKGLKQKKEMGDTEGRAGIWVAMVLGAGMGLAWGFFLLNAISRG